MVFILFYPLSLLSSFYSSLYQFVSSRIWLSLLQSFHFFPSLTFSSFCLICLLSVPLLFSLFICWFVFLTLYFFIKSSLRRGKCLCWIGFLDKIWIFYVTKMLKEAELKNGMPCTWTFFFHFQFVKVRDLAKNIFFNYQFLIWIIK